MKQVFANKKLLLFSFLIPFALATASYHLVYVCDAGIRGGQALDLKYPNIPIKKAVEMEEDHRWQDASAWGVHALVIGIPAGLLSLIVASGFYWMISRREKADDAA